MSHANELQAAAGAFQSAQAKLAAKTTQTAARIEDVARHEAGIADVAKTLEGLDSQTEIAAADLLDAENLRRRLTRLEMERGLALESLALAREEEKEAQRAAELAHIEALVPDLNAEVEGLCRWSAQLNEAAAARLAPFLAKLAQAEALISKAFPNLREASDARARLPRGFRNDKPGAALLSLAQSALAVEESRARDAAREVENARLDKEHAARLAAFEARGSPPGGSYPGTHPGILGSGYCEPEPQPALTSYEPYR